MKLSVVRANGDKLIEWGSDSETGFDLDEIRAIISFIDTSLNFYADEDGITELIMKSTIADITVQD